MNKEKALENRQISDATEAHRRRDQIIACKVFINRGKLAMGKLLEEGHQKRDWIALGYDSEDDWVSDPHNIGIRPRTARSRRALWRFYEYCCQRFGIEEDEILKIDASKLEAVAKSIKAEADDNKAMLIFESTKTNVLREIIQNEEEKEYDIHEFEANCHKIFNEKSGRIYHFSQGKSRLDISAQTLWDTFGNKTVKVKMMVKKEQDNPND